MLRSHSFELENFSEAHTNLLSLGDQLCILCEGGCQEFIQNKLSFLGKLIEEMKVQATLMYNELIPLVSTIIQLKNNINRIEGIISETENNLCHIIQTYSNAKPDVYMNFLIKGKSLLKMYANKLVLGCNLLDSFLGIKALDLTVVLSRYKEAEQKLNKIHCSLSKEMEGVFNSIHDNTLTQLVVGASHLNLYEKFFQSLQDENSSENSSDITKRLHQLEDFFNDKYFADINLSIENLSQCSKDIDCVDTSEGLANLREICCKLGMAVRSTKIIMHFSITFRELHEVLKLRESFLQVSDKPSYIADNFEFISLQIEELFGDDFKICQTYYQQLRNRYNQYLSGENIPHIQLQSLITASSLESLMRERLEALETSFTNFNATFKQVEISINTFRINSQNILVFADKLEAAFTQKENSTIRDSSVLETQCNIWELLILEGQNFLTQYDHSFEDAYHIYDNLSPSPKVVFVKNIFPKANEYLDLLKSSLNLYQGYQAELKLNEDRLSNLSSNFSHFYTEMRFPSISINGTAIDKYIQRSDEFRNELQAIKNTVRRLRIGIPELQAGTHEVVEYCIIEEERLKVLEEKLPQWQNKMDRLSNECHNSTNNLVFETQLSDDRTNEHGKFLTVMANKRLKLETELKATFKRKHPIHSSKLPPNKWRKIQGWKKRSSKTGPSRRMRVPGTYRQQRNAGNKSGPRCVPATYA